MHIVVCHSESKNYHLTPHFDGTLRNIIWPMLSHFLVCCEHEQLPSTKNVTSVLKPTLFTCLRTRNLSIMLYDKMEFQSWEIEFGVKI